MDAGCYPTALWDRGSPRTGEPLVGRRGAGPCLSEVPVMAVTARDEGAVRIVTIDRPRAMNALDPEHFRALHDAVGLALREGGVRAVVLAAEGRVFSVGADV